MVNFFVRVFVFEVLFRFHADFCHGFHSLHGVFSRGRFAGEHDGAGAVVDGVGDVGDLGTGGTGLVDHGFQHFRRCDAAFSCEAAFVDEHFLDLREFLVGDLHAEVAAGNHDAVCNA